MTTPRISLGAVSVGNQELSTTQGLLDTLDKHHVREIDTARRYVCLLPYASEHMLMDQRLIYHSPEAKKFWDS